MGNSRVIAVNPVGQAVAIRAKNWVGNNFCTVNDFILIDSGLRDPKSGQKHGKETGKFHFASWILRCRESSIFLSHSLCHLSTEFAEEPHGPEYATRRQLKLTRWTLGTAQYTPALRSAWNGGGRIITLCDTMKA